MMNDKISIIIPAYNIEDYIEKCLESVINQSYSNIEIIIVNDGSTDNTGEICEKFIIRDARIKYIKQSNEGLVAARKTGLRNATGNYIVFVDGDDYIKYEQVEKLYAVMLENDVDFVHSNYIINGKNANHIKNFHKYTKEDLSLEFRIKLLKEHIFEWDMQKDIFECNLYGCIYKSEFIKECYCSLSDVQQYGEDLLCFCNQIMKCSSMIMLPEAYYYYVLRDGSLDHPKDYEDAVMNKILLYKEIKKLLNTYGILSELSEKCKMFFSRNMLLDFKPVICERIKVEDKHRCDFIDILHGKKVAIYGAGKVGNNIYEHIRLYSDINIISWVDKNYKNINNVYMNITSPQILDSLQYDYILIAIENEEIAKQVINELINRNIERNKIIWNEYKKEFVLTLK